MRQLITFIFIATLLSCDNSADKNSATITVDSSQQIIPQQTTSVTSDSGQQSTKESFRPSDCVRGTPEPVVKKDVFPKTAFQLQADSLTAFETVYFDNGDKLIIENSGCEYYILSFRFETSRFQNDTTSSKYWFRQALQLIKEMEKGLDTPVGMDDGIIALAKYIDKTDEPKFGEELDYGGNEIRYFVTVDRVQKLSNKNFAIELSFAVGPL